MIVYQDGNFKIVKDGTSYYKLFEGRKRIARFLFLSDAKDSIETRKKLGITAIDNIPKNKRFVVYSTWQLGIESSYENEQGKECPFWHVYDKLNDRIVDCVDLGFKSHALKESEKLNKDYYNGLLNEESLFWD